VLEGWAACCGVAGGATAAARIRRMDENCDITIFERGTYVSFANCGLPYFIGDVIKTREDLLLADPALFKARFNVDVKTEAEVIAIDRKAKSVEVKDLKNGIVVKQGYDYLILCPGAVPFRPSWPGVDLEGVFTLRSIPDSERIKAYARAHRLTGNAVVIGGGFIGLEMAENLSLLGFKVSILERSNQLMPPFDPEMAVSLEEYLSEKGLQVCLNRNVSGIIKCDNNLQIQTEQGHFDADIVILGIGVRPDTYLAKQCGLNLGETGGVKVDEQMRTSDPSIFAVGDCVESMNFVTGRPVIIPLAGPANRQARVAADVICGRAARFRGIQGTAVCKVFDMVIACTGANEKTLQRSEIEYQKIYTHPNNHVGYYPGAKKITMKILFDPTNGKVMGAQAIGKEGVDKRIDVLATAIQAKMSVFDLEEVELCYAPQVGSAKDPVNLLGMVASNILRHDHPVVHWNMVHSKLPDVFLLDVRNKSEYDTYHIEESKLIPLPEIRKRLDELPRNKPIYVFCAVGQRGYYATRILRNHGFDAYNISGGIATEKSTKGKSNI